MSSEKRFAMDGNAQGTADNATNAADNATDAASPQRQLHATEQNSTSAEPEFDQLVLLAALDINFLRALEDSEFRPPRSLHKLARDALNALITAGVNSHIDRNLEHWFPWRRYIACHKHAYDIVGTGVTRAIAEYIPSSSRGYQNQLNFVVYRADGTSCYVYPELIFKY